MEEKQKTNPAFPGDGENLGPRTSRGPGSGSVRVTFWRAVPTSELPDPHLAGSLFRLGKRNEAPKGSGGEHTLGVGPVTPGQMHGLQLYPAPRQVRARSRSHGTVVLSPECR